MVAVRISSSTVTAEDLAARLGIKPDQSWKAGAMRGAFRVVEKQHGFVLESNLQPYSGLEDHVQEMLKRLSPCAQKLGALANEVTVEFSCTVARKTAPQIKFSRDELRWLAVMGARLIVDTTIIKDEPNKGAAAPPAPGGKPAL